MHCFTPLTHFAPPHPCLVEMMGTPEPTHFRSVFPPPPLLYTKTRFYLIKPVIREIKMICFILKIRMSSCLLQSVTWQLYKLIQMVYTSRMILQLFIEVLSQCSTAVGHPLPGGWVHISVCPDLPELLFLSTRFSRKNYIN